MKNKYNVTFAKAPEYNAEFEISLEKSGAFSYGNGTCVVVKRNGKVDEAIDTRYDKAVSRDFDKWCADYLKDKFNPDLEPHIEKM